MQLLNEEKINEYLAELPGWNYLSDSIQKTFVMKDFSSVIAYVGMIGIASEKLDHHPDLRIYEWNKLDVIISTHSSGGITNKDFELANQIERLL